MEAKSKPPREALSVVPPELAEAIRAACLDEDSERLYELVDGVAEHDAEVADYVRGFIDDMTYALLEDLFDVRGR